MKRVLKITGVLLVLILISVLVFGLVIHKPLPKGKNGNDADVLATKMLTSLNYNAYVETKTLEWSFREKHHYKWNKEKGTVKVSWSTVVVHLNLTNTSKSTVVKKGKQIEDVSKEKLIAKAITYFNNDSFWLVAPYKIFDSGTTRSIVVLKDGTKGLLITYSSGGSTPGDSYLWKLNPQGFPESFQMWVGIIPIGGINASWEDWKKTRSGIYLPKSHKLGPASISMGNVKAY